jgi:hypothetical protein
MKDSKSTGIDGVPAEMWKIFCCPEGGLEILVRLFSEVKEGKDFPTYWKIAVV